jgi:hypothetical protein
LSSGALRDDAPRESGARTASATALGGAEWLDARAEKVEAGIDWIIQRRPDGRRQSQTLASEALGVQPPPELLQALERVASAEGAPALTSPLARAIMVLCVLTDLELRDLFLPTVLEPDLLGRCSSVFPELQRRLEEILRALGWLSEDTSPRERETLEKLAGSLLPEGDLLVACGVLAPRLEHLARSAMNGRIVSEPWLEDAEIELFSAAIPGRIEQTTEPERALLDAAALRYAILEDLEAWSLVQEVGETREPEGETGTAVLAAPIAEHRENLLEELRADLTAYRVIAGRLQDRHDELHTAGSVEEAASVARAKREVFAAFTELTAALRDPRKASGETEKKDDPEGAEALARLLEEAERADTEAQEGLSEDEVCLDALREMRDGRQPGASLPPGAEDLRRERRRRRRLVVTAAALLPVAVAVNLFFLLRAPERQVTDPEVFFTAVPVRQVVPVGAMMVSEVSSVTWGALTEGERRMRVERLGRMAVEQGYASVYVVDESGAELATWKGEDTTELLPPAEEPRP